MKASTTERSLLEPSDVRCLSIAADLCDDNTASAKSAVVARIARYSAISTRQQTQSAFGPREWLLLLSLSILVPAAVERHTSFKRT